MSYTDKLFNKVPLIRNILDDNSCIEIFHYTKPSKLLSMLESGTIRFSNALYLNDKEEITYSYQLILKILDSTLELNSDLRDKIKTHFQSKCNGLVDDSEEFEYTFEYYTSSFSTESDNLTLWNNYTKDKSYTGYNIGFDKIALIDEMINANYYPIYGKIIYDKKKQTEILTTIIKKWNSKFEKASKSKKVQDKHDSTRLINLLLELTDILSIVGIFFKNPHFKNEQEYRIVLVNNFSLKSAKQTKICEKNGIFVPYIECAFSKNTVKSINVGPTLNENVFKMGTKRMLLNFGYKCTKINQSKIPLRY